MAFPFKKIDYKVYSKTFLRKVLVGISYDTDGISLEDVKTPERFNSFLKQRFDLEMDVVDFKESVARVSNEEQGVGYLFSKDLAAVVLEARDYKSFQASVAEYIPALVSFARDVLNIRVVDSCFIRKLNVFSLESEESIVEGMDTTQGLVFSESFLNTPTGAIDSTSSKHGIEKQLSWSSQELTIVSRYCHRIPDLHHVQHWLDLEVINKPTLPMVADRLEESEMWFHMNQFLFDAFHWCVSTRVIDLME